MHFLSSYLFLSWLLPLRQVAILGFKYSCLIRCGSLTRANSTRCPSEFGAVGDGRTLNTIAFQNAIFYLTSFVARVVRGYMFWKAGGLSDASILLAILPYSLKKIPLLLVLRITVTGVSLDQCLLMVETLRYLVDIAA